MALKTALIALAVAIAAAGALAVAKADADEASTRLTLDGKSFKPELALRPATRSVGLMNRFPAPKDGMLFVFPRPTSGGFWMKNVHVPLTITFFDAAGKRLLRLSMAPCHADPCQVYDPARVYRFALEMRPSDRRPAKRLGPVSELRRLVRLSS
jgi:uncharacterized membrane protein (UPF0127 family)